MQQTRPQRSDVPESLTWNLAHIFPTSGAWEAELAAVAAAVPAVVAYRGRLHEGAGLLLACLTGRDALQERLARCHSYASLNNATDGTSPANQAMMGRVGSLSAQVSADLSFIQSEISALPDGTVAAWLDAEPGLALYRQHLREILLAKPHRLHPETEATLAALSEALNAPATIHARATTGDFTFPPVTDADGQEIAMSVSRYMSLAGSTDRDMRRKAYESLTAGLSQHKTTLATALATMIKRNVVTARLRGFGSAEEMILAPQQVPLQVYNNVLDVIQAEAAPHVRRYMKLRQRILGVDKLYRYDLQAPLDPGYNPEVSYAEASDLIQQGLSVLGPEYGEILRRALTERWVDLADNVGKSGGAFCAPVVGVHPYVLITWHGKMRNLFVLAHELGHCGHMALSADEQAYVNSGFSRFFVESPSTANELLLGFHILDNTDDMRMRRFVTMQFLGTFMHNFVNHLLEGELERRLYRHAEAGRPITLATVTEQQGQVFTDFFQDTLTVDDGARLNWMQVPHFYVGLYPFTYAAGLSAACVVADAIRTEGQPAVDRWLKTLKTGGSKFPLELLDMAGVDMSSPTPLRKAVALFGKLVADLEASFT